MADSWKLLALKHEARILALIDEITQLRQQLANVRHCEVCGGDWYDGGLNAPECPWCRLTAKEAEIRAAFAAGLRAQLQLVPGTLDEAAWDFGENGWSDAEASEVFTAYQQSRQPAQGETTDG